MPWAIAVAFLLAYEFAALYFGWTTLSRMMRNFSEGWPFFSTFVGLVVGILLAHFFWTWCP